MIPIALLATELITVLFIAILVQCILLKTLNRNTNKDPKPVAVINYYFNNAFHYICP